MVFSKSNNFLFEESQIQAMPIEYQVGNTPFLWGYFYSSERPEAQGDKINRKGQFNILFCSSSSTLLENKSITKAVGNTRNISLLLKSSSQDWEETLTLV